MEIFRWLRWQWRQFETWQKFWVLGCSFLGAGIMSDGLARKIFFAVPIMILLVYTFKWWIYEPAVSSWRKYKEQRDTLFDTIRGDKEQNHE
jgi:hypothetical protein